MPDINAQRDQKARRIVESYLKEGFENARVISAIAIEGESEWKISAELGQPVRDKEEIVINDRDGQIISYKTARSATPIGGTS